jgi:thymidylate synthase (FAD)
MHDLDTTEDLVAEEMTVELIDHAGGDLSVVNSARVSFNKETSTMTGKDERLIKYLAEHHHDTPFRHNFIQLRCSVPLFLARQLMKHQAGLTWNEESRRYVDYMPKFYYPVAWRKRPDDGIKQGSGQDHPENLFLMLDYDEYIAHCAKMYQKFLDVRVAPEMARMMLPQSMMVNFIWSGNLLAFHHVYKLRSGEGAQQEAIIFADLLKKAIEPEFHESWKALEER